MNISKKNNRYRRLDKPLLLSQPSFINNYDEENIQQDHQPWLNFSYLFSENQDKI